MKDALSLAFFVLLVGFLAWGLLNPGLIKWKRSRVPVSPWALVGGMISVVAAALAVVVTKFQWFDDDRRRAFAIFPLISLAITGSMIAAITSRRDFRRYRDRQRK